MTRTINFFSEFYNCSRWDTFAKISLYIKFFQLDFTDLTHYKYALSHSQISDEYRPDQKTRKGYNKINKIGKLTITVDYEIKLMIYHIENATIQYGK